MPAIPFNELLADAAYGGYAVGYFESWNLESLMAVADAAVATRSPVLLGFSGIYLPHHQRAVHEPLAAYACLGREVRGGLTVPAALVFNESPHLDQVLAALELGFDMVMYSDEMLEPAAQAERVRQVVQAAHAAGIAVEGEAMALPGVGGALESMPGELHLSEPDAACAFVEQTGVDAFAVNVGQMHLHGRREVRLDLGRLDQLVRAVSVPLVLHGATSVCRDDLREAVRLGIRKINVGSLLKQVYFEALRDACVAADRHYNPYEIVGSGLDGDVLVAARVALQRTVEEFMQLFGSAGRAG